MQAPSPPELKPYRPQSFSSASRHSGQTPKSPSGRTQEKSSSFQNPPTWLVVQVNPRILTLSRSFSPCPQLSPLATASSTPPATSSGSEDSPEPAWPTSSPTPTSTPAASTTSLRARRPSSAKSSKDTSMPCAPWSSIPPSPKPTTPSSVS